MNNRQTSADVAVVVPTFNRLDLLQQTVESLRRQTIRNAQFVIVDDRSESATRDYLRSLPSSDSRFQIIEKPDGLARGCQTSRNIGLEASNAHAIVFLDSDDTLEPRCLEQRYAWLVARPEADIVVGRQAILPVEGASEKWVNVPKPGVADIDRILELTHPLDVPWINGGAMIRLSALRSAKVRWRPEYHWDDVAFHFECLASGLKSAWMEYNEPPDSHYRTHTGQRYGSVLFTEAGIKNTADMLAWIRRELGERNLEQPSRLAALERALFKSCVLPSIDAGSHSTAADLIRQGAAARLLRASTARRISAYTKGRRLLAKSHRATFYWNRFSESRFLSGLTDNRLSTYGSVRVRPADQLAH